MYVKLTKLDGTPIWFNASFVVTVEPRKLGGAIVVPIGDGLDYDVRETPEQVLAALDGAPVATVVPVPPPKSLAPTPADVSPDDTAAAPTAEEPAKSEPAKKTRGRTKKAADAAAKPAKKTRTRAAKAKSADPVVEPPAAASDAAPAPAPSAEAAAPSAPAAETLTPEQVERLKKMAPRSLKKLANTLYSQFRVRDAEGVVATLAAQGVLAVEQDRVLWAYAPVPVETL